MGEENVSFAWKSKNLRRFSNGAVGYRDCDERLHTVPLFRRNCSCNFRKHAKVLSDDTNVGAISPPPLSLSLTSADSPTRAHRTNADPLLS